MCNIENMKSSIIYYLLSSFHSPRADEDEDVNLDDLWDTTVWEEIEEINSRGRG